MNRFQPHGPSGSRNVRHFVLWALVATAVLVGVTASLAFVRMQPGPKDDQSRRPRRTVTRTVKEGEPRAPLPVKLLRGNRVEIDTLTVDNWYESLDRLDGLEEMVISEIPIPDAAVAHLRAVTGLKRLTSTATR